MKVLFSCGNETLWWNIKPSPKGGGFLFVGIRKKERDGTVGILSGKGCMTFIMVGEIPDKNKEGTGGSPKGV